MKINKLISAVLLILLCGTMTACGDKELPLPAEPEETEPEQTEPEQTEPEQTETKPVAEIPATKKKKKEVRE